MTRRVPFPFKSTPMPFGDPQIRIVIELDQNGLMKTSINKPLPAVQILGLLLDCMQGQYQAMAQQASLLINPKGGPIGTDKPTNAGEKEEDNNDSRGDSSGGKSTV